jgi:uncharacterized membrane protein
MASVTTILKKELKELPDGWITLLETEAEKSVEVGLKVVKLLTDEGYKGLILSASRPCTSLLSLYKKNKIDTKNIFILDTVCRSQDTKVKQLNNVLHLESSSALTGISLSINEAINKIPGKKFIFIDSITTMLIHNKPTIFGKFMHTVLTRMRMKNMNGMFITLEKETDKAVRAEIVQLCDKVLRV